MLKLGALSTGSSRGDSRLRLNDGSGRLALMTGHSGVQQRHGMGGAHQRVRAASVGGGEAARVAAMHVAVAQGMTPKQAYESLGEYLLPDQPAVPVTGSPMLCCCIGWWRYARDRTNAGVSTSCTG